jgi:hypothetical protein
MFESKIQAGFSRGGWLCHWKMIYQNKFRKGGVVLLQEK